MQKFRQYTFFPTYQTEGIQTSLEVGNSILIHIEIYFAVKYILHQ